MLRHYQVQWDVCYEGNLKDKRLRGGPWVKKNPRQKLLFFLLS